MVTMTMSLRSFLATLGGASSPFFFLLGAGVPANILICGHTVPSDKKEYGGRSYEVNPPTTGSFMFLDM